MAYLVYHKEQASLVIESCQPIIDEGVGPCILAAPIESTDGRYCHVHPWSEDELIWLEARTSGITGIQILTELPSNWESKGE